MADRNSRKRPFSSWVKRLANLKTSSHESGGHETGTSKRSTVHNQAKSKQHPSEKVKPSKNPYPDSGAIEQRSTPSRNGHLSFQTPPSELTRSEASLHQHQQSGRSSIEGQSAPTLSNKSTAPTLATNPDTTHSDAANSSKADSTAAATNATVGGALSSHGGGGGSTFSSPAHSEHSLTTTLTTIQSTTPSNLVGASTNLSQSPGSIPTQANQTGNPLSQSSTGGHHQSHPSSSSSPPPSALPSHLGPQAGPGNPSTYTAATANNLLTDNASILTLASSSKRRRRHSLDTDASVRALAPSSLWGGSRESLPLSVLSGNPGEASTAGVHQQSRGNVSTGASGIPSGERASVYSASGAAPALSSERNSYYAGRQNYTTDGSSVKSSLLGHGRNDSITGSIGGASSPLASPREISAGGPARAQSPGPNTHTTQLQREMQTAGRGSRRSSGWGELSSTTGSTADTLEDNTTDKAE